jgi:hypothetical protein
VERVRMYKYVGVWMNEECSWANHMSKLREKGLKLTAQMKGWLFRHWGVSVPTKVEVWKAMVGSVLRHGSEVWWLGVLPARDLEVVQMDACRDIMRIFGSTTTALVRREFGLAELERERHVAMLVWYGRLCYMDEKRWAKKLFVVERRARKDEALEGCCLCCWAKIRLGREDAEGVDAFVKPGAVKKRG